MDHPDLPVNIKKTFHGVSHMLFLLSSEWQVVVSGVRFSSSIGFNWNWHHWQSTPLTAKDTVSLQQTQPTIRHRHSSGKNADPVVSDRPKWSRPGAKRPRYLFTGLYVTTPGMGYDLRAGPGTGRTERGSMVCGHGRRVGSMKESGRDRRTPSRNNRKDHLLCLGA